VSVLLFSLEQLEDRGVIKLGRGKIISKTDLESNPGNFPVYSSSKVGDGKFGEYGFFMFDEELITWSVDGGGKLFHREKHKFSITNVTGFLRILKTEIIEYKYLFYCLTFLHSSIQFDWVKKAHPSVLRKEYKNIPLPPLDTQQKIVAKLDAIFADIDKATVAAEANAKNSEALFQSYLTQVFEYGGEGWKDTNLKDIAEYFNGLTYSPKDVCENGIIVLRSSNVQDDKIVLDDIVRVNSSIKEKLYVRNGDILMCSRNGSKRLVGKTATISTFDEKMTFGTFMMIVRGDNNFFLEWFFKSDVFKRQISSGENTMINQITRYMLDEIVVPMPDLPTQKLLSKKISGLYDASQSVKEFYLRKVTDFKKLKHSILKQAFSGELVKE
jgi:type I restriction enzyme, S subunit